MFIIFSSKKIQLNELSYLPTIIPSPYVGFSHPQNNSNGIYIPPISVENEIKVLQLLKSLAQEQVEFLLHLYLYYFYYFYFINIKLFL